MSRSRDRDSDSGGYASPESIEDEEDASPITEFYKDRSIFITGVTGFVGKVLLEKLLRACSGLKTVYVLMRVKDGQNPRERLEELFTCQIFRQIRRENPSILTKVVPITGDIGLENLGISQSVNRDRATIFRQIRRENPSILTKVVPITGDISLENLGISQSDTTILTKHVSVVFHSAATVRFDEPLKKSVDLNLLGTQRVLELCHKMIKLSALVHVSTAYSFCNRREIDDIIYPEKISPQHIIDLTRWMDEKLQETILPKIMDGRPTTYHYSKALAENLLVSEGGDLPIAVVRPSIVTAAFKEPLPGWVDGVNGPTSFIIMTGRGLLRTMLVYEGSVVDWMPVDLVVNLLITAAWNIATHRSGTIKVFNCTSCDLNKVTWADVERTAYPIVIKNPDPRVLRYPGGSFKSSTFMNTLSIKIEHALPAYFLDLFRWILGQKPQYVNMVRRMERAAGYLQYFTTKEWKFYCRNLIQLRDSLTPKDKQIFNFDIRPVEWAPYLESYVLGVRKFILKEKESSLPAARRRLMRLYYAEKLAKWGLAFLIIYVLFKKTNLSQHLLWTFINITFQLMQHMPRSWLKYISSFYN